MGRFYLSGVAESFHKRLVIGLNLLLKLWNFCSRPDLVLDDLIQCLSHSDESRYSRHID